MDSIYYGLLLYLQYLATINITFWWKVTFNVLRIIILFLKIKKNLDCILVCTWPNHTSTCGSVLESQSQEWKVVGSNPDKILAVKFCQSPSLIVRHSTVVIIEKTS